MNIRVILLVLLVIIFTLGCVLFSFISFDSNSLKDAYQEGNVEIIQNTAAGTVPHLVVIKNTGKKPLVIETGQVLTSNSSQDLVVAQNKKINQNSSAEVKAYCFQPGQKAISGSKLIPSDKASSQITKVIQNSNLNDKNNATQTQLQIWILVSQDNVNLNSGEASALVEKQEITSAKILQELSDARSNLIKSLNITTGDLKNKSNDSSSNIFSDIYNLITGFINWIINSFGIKTL